MTTQQLAVLNSLVTYAAENIPGGLSDDEREVAQIVGSWVLTGTLPKFKGIECTCAKDREGGAPEGHVATCPWAIVELQQGIS